jgi:hypothetical protein
MLNHGVIIPSFNCFTYGYIEEIVQARLGRKSKITQNVSILARLPTHSFVSEANFIGRMVLMVVPKFSSPCI